VPPHDHFEDRLGIVIVGAGPSGLLTALKLAQLGVADRVSQAALPWRFGTSFYRGQPVYRLQVPHDDDQRFFPMSNLQQQFLEQYLLEACFSKSPD